MRDVQAGHILFLELFVPNDSAVALPIFICHTCWTNVVNSLVGKQGKRFETLIQVFIRHRATLQATCFPLFTPWYGSTELHSLMPLQVPKFYISLEWACCFLLFTTMSPVIGNHTFLQWNCSPRSGVSRVYLTSQDFHSREDEDFEEYVQTYHKALNQKLLVQKYWGRFPIYFTICNLVVLIKTFIK